MWALCFMNSNARVPPPESEVLEFVAGHARLSFPPGDNIMQIDKIQRLRDAANAWSN